MIHLDGFNHSRYPEELPEDGASLLCRGIASDSASKSCVALGREWLDTCLNKHEQCKALSNAEEILPTRVIDVGNENQHPKLITTNGKSGNWVALSYCWGGNSDFVLNINTMAGFQEGIPVEEFPGTLRDAIIITRNLGIKYIWIDALCIQQDSKEDWAREAAKMREVYSGAVLTVTASSAPSTSSGIFSPRVSKNARVTLEWKTSSGEGKRRIINVYLRPGSELWDHKLQGSRLTTRGWTLQEGLLAPRTLSYGEQQMIWECSQYQTDEGGRTTSATEDYRAKGFIQRLMKKLPAAKIPKSKSILSRLMSRQPEPDEWWKEHSIANPYDQWYNILDVFAARSLTVDTDALPAMAGIARAFQGLLKDEYCAGLWKKDILCSLFWARSPRFPEDRTTARFDPARASNYLAPSWSWASIPGKQLSMGGNWKIRNDIPDAISVAKIISVNTTPANDDPFGQLVGGELVIKGRFCVLENVPPVYSTSEEFPALNFPEPSSCASYSFQKQIYHSLLQINVMVYEFYQQHEPHPDQHFGAIEIIRWEKDPASHVPGMDFLILESTGREEGEYKRVSQIGIRKHRIPDKKAVTTEQYEGTVLETKAYEEVISGNWKKRTIKIV